MIIFVREHDLTSGLVEYCKYSDLKDKIIRDRLVVGILNNKTSEQLQMDHALT